MNKLHNKFLCHNNKFIRLLHIRTQSGMLRTKRGDYYIEPSKHHRVNDAGHYPHIVFQRSSIKVNQINEINFFGRF